MPGNIATIKAHARTLARELDRLLDLVVNAEGRHLQAAAIIAARENVEDLIKDKRLLIVPSGSLTQLPYQVAGY